MVSAEFSAVPARRRPSATFVLIQLLTCAWAVVWASSSAYLFLCSRLPVPNYLYAGATFPGGSAWWGPGWLSLWLIVGGLLALPLTAIGLLALLPLGLSRLQHAPASASRWMTLWAVATVVAMGLEVIWILNIGSPDISKDIGRVVLDWSRLIEAGGFLAIAALMIGIQVAAGRARSDR